MSQIILDIGSGNSLKTEMDAIKLIDAIKEVDTGKHEVVLKAQLFRHAPPNIPLDHHIFLVARSYAWTLGYKMTSSVFDRDSSKFLLSCDNEHNRLPFVKIACRPELYWLIGEVPRRIEVLFSADFRKGSPDPLYYHENVRAMWCISEYPANKEDYIIDGLDEHPGSVSDHTVGWDLFRECRETRNDVKWFDNFGLWEKHVVLERDPKNPDAGPFACTPEELREIL